MPWCSVVFVPQTSLDHVSAILCFSHHHARAHTLTACSQHHSACRSSTSDAQTGAFIDETPPEPPGNLLAPTNNLVDRPHESVQIYRCIHHNALRVVVIKGPPGIGKTELALCALQYSRQRSEFEHGYFMVEMKRIQAGDVGALVDKLIMSVGEAGGTCCMSMATDDALGCARTAPA